MKHLFSIFAAVICLGTLPLAAVTGDQLRQALDLPGSIKVSAPGQYKGSTAAWSIAGDGAVPATPVGKQCIYDGSVRSEGGSCVVGNVPPRNGYEGHLNLRSRNFFTVSVKGTGSFKFRYRTSVAYAQDAALLIYEYDGNNSAKLNVDEYDNPYGTIPLPVDESYEEHFWEGEAWPVYEGEETWSPDPGGISAPTFWKEKEIFLDNSRYTHQLVFAALGPAMYDGTEGNLITGEELFYEGEVKEDKIYLDNFRWIPDSDEYAPRVLVFSKPDGTVFANKMLLTLSTEYDEKVFRFYYTTDGTEPTVRSKEYIIYDPNGENADTDVNDDMNYGIHLNADTTVKVLVTERLSGETVGTYKASYTHKNLDGPSVNVTPENNFSDTTAIEFVGNYQGYSSWAFYHTLDGTEPTEESISGGIFTYKNSELDGKTLKVIAVVNETLISETVSIRLERLQPRITWELDGAAASADDFVFASRAKVAPPADGVRYAM
ncbi:MAG: chitobiase/beta-hexosaminidase C-terminal domain-containing protein [Victivallales bacterium]|nr:chitobiase/beta-hexosaminidase C-terminal domain-containing protein [Victivallales bacterium]